MKEGRINRNREGSKEGKMKHGREEGSKDEKTEAGKQRRMYGRIDTSKEENQEEMENTQNRGRKERRN